MKRKHFIYAFMALLSCFVFSANAQVAKIGEQSYATLAEAVAAAEDGETVSLLWQEDQEPIAMNGSVFGKNITITGTAKVDWSKGNLFVGRGGEGNATVTFDGANLTSASNSASYGIHVSGREKNTTSKYDGTLVIKNSTIELDYLINKGAMTLDKAALTVKNGFATGGRPATETESGQDATATISLTNESKLVVNNHNGMGLGYEAIGVMNIDATSTFETTQSFLVTAKGTMNIAGKAIVTGTLTNQGAINLTSENATLKAQEGLTVNSIVDGCSVIYADGVYSTKLGLKGKGTEAEPHLIYNIKELVAFRNSVNGGETKYSAPGVWVALAADIDMSGENWVGIGTTAADHGFMGNFDGQGYKIKNLTITNPAIDSDGYAYAGLFGVTEGTDKDNQNTIKNLTIENVTITTTGHIAAAAVAYPYYTIIDNVKVCGNIKIQGGNYTAGVLAYTRRCVNASNLSIVGKDGSFVKGEQTVGGVISDIQMNGGLTAVYSNFSAEGITVTGEKNVGGIAGIIATQTLNGATVKNVTLNSTDEFAGVVAGRLGGTSTISNVVSENVTGATAVIGATYDGAKAVEARIGNIYYATFAEAYAAAKAGETVSMLADLNMSEILVLDKDITLDGNGKTLTSTNARAINVSGADGVTIKNLTINASGERAINIIQKATNVTIDKVTATAANYTVNVASSAPNAVVAISNSNLTGLNVVNVAAPQANVTINGGTITCNDQNASENYAALVLNKDAVKGKITASDVTFDIKGDSKKASNGAEGGVITIDGNTDGVDVVVAYISYGDNSYTFTSLEVAIAAAKEGETITLLRDVTTSEIIVLNKAITLNGNGKTLTSTATGTNARAINVSGANGVTIKNLTIDAKGERAINVIQNATNVTIENVTATAANYTVNVASSAPEAVVAINNSNLTGLNVVNVAAPQANVTINGGTITCNDQNASENYAALVLHKDGKNATIAATGVTFDIKGDSKKAKNGAEGGVITIDGKTDEVVVNVAYIHNGGNYYYAYPSLEAAIAAAKEGETITLLRDVTTSEIIVLNKAITLDGNGKTLTSTATGPNARAINVSGANGVTIQNLTINASGERAINIIQNATNVTIDKVTATAANYTVNVASSAPNAVVAINNSTLNGLCTVNVSAEGAKVTVDNSTVNCNDNNTTTGESYAALSLNKEAVGGSIVATNTIVNVAADSDSMKGRNGAEDGTVTINGSTEGVAVMVAVITYQNSDNYHAFATLEEAIEFAKADDVVTLIRDITVSGIITIDKAITLDGNSKTLTSTAGRAINVSGADGVTIKNLTIDAKGERAINVIQNATNVTIENVTATAANYTVNVASSAPEAVVTISGSNLTGLNVVNVASPGADVTITNATITCNDQNASENYAALVLNKDAVNGKITASGVTFNIKGDSKKASNGAEGGVITIDGKTDGVDVVVAYISYGDNSYTFTSIEAAIEAAKEGETITMLAPVVIAAGETLTLDKNITIAYTSNVAGEDMFTNRGTLNISAGTITYANTDATASNVTVSTISSEPGSVLNITGGTVENKTVKADGSSIYSYAIDMLTNGNLGDVTATIEGGKVYSDYMAIRQFNNGTVCKNTLNITGGHIYGAKRAVQVHLNNNAAYTTISGGKIEAGADGYAICNFAATGNLELTGGEFIGAVYSARENFISGGIYNNPVEAAYCAEGYIPTQNENGYYEVVPGTYVAKNGDKYYVTLEEALDAEGNKVELLVPYVVAVGETKTLDLKGKTIIGTPSEAKAYAVITNKGTLTITGSGTILCNHTLAGSTGYAVNTITNLGTLNIEDDVTIENKSTAQHQIGYAIDNNSTSTDAVVNIKGGKVTASGSLYYDGIRLFCNSETKENSVVVEGGEVSTIWMQNPSDGATKNTKDVMGSIAISGGNVGVLSLEPSVNFEASVTGGHVGKISYFQSAEGRNLVEFVTGGTFGMDVTEFCALHYVCSQIGENMYSVALEEDYIPELVIDDSEGKNYTSTEEKTVGTLTYKRTLPNVMKWNPLYVPFAIPMSELIDNYDVAYFNDVRGNDANGDNVLDDGTLKMELVQITNANVTLNANYPFVFRAKTEEARNLELVLNDVKLCENKENSVVFTSLDIRCEVKGSYTKRKTVDKQYIVNKNGVWSPLDQNYYLNPYRLILTLSSNDQLKPFGARDIRMFVIGEEGEDGTTHIFDVENEAQTQDCIYDLQGRRVLAPQKGGLYIVNGKKTIIK